MWLLATTKLPLSITEGISVIIGDDIVATEKIYMIIRTTMSPL